MTLPTILNKNPPKFIILLGQKEYVNFSTTKFLFIQVFFLEMVIIRSKY